MVALSDGLVDVVGWECRPDPNPGSGSECSRAMPSDEERKQVGG